jgi:hypothetical protein
MAKRGSLFARDQEPQPRREAPPPTPRNTSRPPSREGKNAVTFYVTPEAAKQLKRLMVDEESSVQALMVEALNDLFTKRGLGRIA